MPPVRLFKDVFLTVCCNFGMQIEDLTECTMWIAFETQFLQTLPREYQCSLNLSPSHAHGLHAGIRLVLHASLVGDIEMLCVISNVHVMHACLWKKLKSDINAILIRFSSILTCVV